MIVFIHSATINNYVDILDEMLDVVLRSGLCNKAKIVVSLTGGGAYSRHCCDVVISSPTT